MINKQLRIKNYKVLQTASSVYHEKQKKIKVEGLASTLSLAFKGRQDRKGYKASIFSDYSSFSESFCPVSKRLKNS